MSFILTLWSCLHVGEDAADPGNLPLSPKKDRFLEVKIGTVQTLPPLSASQSAWFSCHSWQFWVWLNYRRLFPCYAPPLVTECLSRALSPHHHIPVSRNLLGPTSSSITTIYRQCCFHQLSDIPLATQLPQLNIRTQQCTHAALPILASTTQLWLSLTLSWLLGPVTTSSGNLCPVDAPSGSAAGSLTLRTSQRSTLPLSLPWTLSSGNLWPHLTSRPLAACSALTRFYRPVPFCLPHCCRT